MPYKNKTKQRAYMKAWMRQRRESWLEANGPCVTCGSWDHLELDHVDGTAKVSHRVWSWTVAKREVELAKCQVLCESCHKKKSSEERKRRMGPVPHGTRTGYDRGCRCKACADANYAYTKAWRLRRRVEKERTTGCDPATSAMARRRSTY